MQKLVIVYLKKCCLLLLLCMATTLSFSQTQQDVQLALEYFKKGEYDKSAVMYEKLYNKAPSNSLFYQNYIQSLIALKQYDETEKNNQEAD
jgi:tetratricopeptide (TPR) repeat protein